MGPLLKRLLAVPPAAAAASAIWLLAEFGTVTGAHPAFLYAFVVTSLGLLLIPLPASYALRNVAIWVQITALAALGAAAGAFILSVLMPPLAFFAPGFWCGGIGTALWATVVTVADRPNLGRNAIVH
jgi:hypothetical protein